MELSFVLLLQHIEDRFVVDHLFSWPSTASSIAGTKVRRYIPQVDFFSKGLYMFDIGQNDLAGLFYSKTEDQIVALIPTILLEFETGLKVFAILPLQLHVSLYQG
jgi:hypothetical protein